LSGLAALYIASSIILPVVLAFVLNLLLQPAVRLLERLRLPRAIGALLAILLIIGALVGLVAALSVPAASWAKRLPEGIPRLEAHLVVLKGPIQALQSVIQQAEQVADDPAQKGSSIAVRRDFGLTGALFAGMRAVLDGLFTTVLVLYFLLVSGDTFLRRIVEILPNFGEKRQAVDISQQIQEDVSAYLVTITAMNAAVGIATAAAMYLCGLGDPLLWGATAFLLNYIPILGPLFGIVMFLLAGLLSFESLWLSLLPPAIYFGIHLVEGETLTPMLLARRFTLNPVLVILSLLFWFWMWGVPGAVLAVPMLAIVKIISDRVRPLKALGHFLEGE
jgi:predicted PurR-regulated permease PerM